MNIGNLHPFSHSGIRAILLVLSMVSVALAAPDAPSDLKTNYRVHPLGIDDPAPHLSWRVQDPAPGAVQSAYQIQAAASPEDLMTEKSLLWDTGKIVASENIQIPYAGRALESRQRVHWRVRTWDAEGKASPWSEPTRFETAFLKESDWQDAAWIGSTQDRTTPELAPADVMGDWIAAPEGFATSQFAVEVDLPDKPIVSAMAYWGFTPALPAGTLAAGIISFEKPGDSPYNTEMRHLLKWSRRGYTDYAFYLEPGKRNRIGLHFSKPVTGLTVTVGMRIVFADGEEKIVRSDHTWQAIAARTHETVPVAVAGPYGGKEFGVAKIYPRERLAPLWIRRAVDVKPGLKSARFYVSALGWGRAYVNGQPVDDSMLTPPQTDYEDFSYYTTYDVTSLLRDGDNALAVYLAPGWYDKVGGFGALSYGHPGLRGVLALEYADGKTEWVLTGPDWDWKRGALDSANVYFGERVDYRKDHDEWKLPDAGTGWQPVQVLPPLTPKLVALDAAPVRPTRVIQPVKSWQLGPKTWIYDLGEVIHGMVRFDIDEPEGTTIRVRYVEMANADGKLENVPVSNWWCHGLTQCTEIISDGKPRTYQSEFCTQSFRYFEISGVSTPPQNVEGLLVRTDAEKLMAFESSDPMLNRLFANGMRTHTNYVSHMLADIPRERCMWGAESTYSWVTAFNGFDWPLNQKLMTDLWLTGAMAPGGVPASVAVGKRLTDTPVRDFNWSATAIPLAYRIFSHYGDLRTAEKHYDKLRHILKWFEENSKDGVFITTQGYADHASPFGVERTPPNAQLIQMFGFFEAQMMFATLADALGKTADAEHARAMAAKIREAILTYYDRETHTFGNGTHDSLALAAGIFADDPAETAALAASLAGYYQQNGHVFDGGFLSYNIYPELSRHGYVDDAYKMLVNDTYPGPAQSITEHDATTYFEAYFPDLLRQRARGLNFFAFAHPTGWMVTDLAGIRPDPAVPGGARIILAPQIPVREKLDWVKGELLTAQGLIKSAWRKEGNDVIWDFTIPPNTSAEVRFPVPGFEAPAKLLRKDARGTIYEMNAGAYSFRMPLPSMPATQSTTSEGNGS